MSKTYTRGFTITSLNIIKKSDFYDLCKILSEEFNKYYNTTEYIFEPEPISEGGILFKQIPNMKNKMYKSMRIYISQYGNYGYINDNILDEWKNNNDILCNKNVVIDTFLKSFNDAHLWTI
jgi:hypothetical protein